MKQAITFHLPVHKATQLKEIVEVGDTVTLVISNDGGPYTTQDVVLTGVSDAGRTIQWDAGTTGNLGTRHGVRVHAKHQYRCPGEGAWQAVLTELNGATVAAKITSLTINGVVYQVNVSESVIADGLEPAFVAAVQARLQELVGSNGYVTAVAEGVAGSQTLTININGTSHVYGAWVLEGLTAGAWTNP